MHDVHPAVAQTATVLSLQIAGDRAAD